MAMSESTFNSYLAKILSARYGEEVRGSIHDSLQGMYEIVKQNTLDVTTAKQTIDTAAAAANSAASKANTAASNADAATSKANASATKADTAAAGADTAKNAANTAASNATTEAGKATTAATQANAAKEAANTAASSANSAASAATEAAGKVDSAIESAEQKTDEAVEKTETAIAQANTAKTEADKAANRANDAAAIIETLDVGDINTGEIATKRYVTEKIDAIEIGGRNYIINTSNPIEFTWNNDNTQITFGDKMRTASDDITKSLYDKTITISFDYDCNLISGSVKLQDYGTFLNFYEFTPDDNGKGRFVKTIDLSANPSTTYFENGKFLYMQGKYNGTIIISHLKFELGNKATDWSPAPEDVDAKIDGIEIGGRNLLRNSGKPVTNSSYPIAIYDIGDLKPVEGQTYTVQVKGTLGAGKIGFGIFNTGGNLGLINLTTPDTDGIYRGTFKWRNTGGMTTVDGTSVHVFPYPYSGDGVSAPTSTIEWIKLERGNKSTDWTPAPEDNNVLGNYLGKFNDAASGKQAIYDWVVSLKNQSNNGGYGMTLFDANFTKDEETLGQLYSGLYLLIGFSHSNGAYAGIHAISYWKERTALYATINNGEWASLFQHI